MVRPEPIAQLRAVGPVGNSTVTSESQQVWRDVTLYPIFASPVFATSRQPGMRLHMGQYDDVWLIH